MLDGNDLLKAIRKAAAEAVEAGKPTAVTYGRITSVEPLMVEVDQKIQLGEKQLSFGEGMQEYETEVEVEIEEMELDLDLQIDGGETVKALAKGSGTVKGKGKIKRCLDAGEEVILVRVQGGQKYVVYDKVKKNES